MANWNRAIGALRRLRGSDLANRAQGIAEAAPEADRQFTQDALVDALQAHRVGVGPGSAYGDYHPLHPLPQSGFSMSRGAIDEDMERVYNLRNLLNRGQGFNEVPWMNFSVEGDPAVARLRGQEGRHRSMAIGDQSTLVSLFGQRYNPRTPGLDQYVPTVEELMRMPVTPMSPLTRRLPPLFGERYQLFNEGGGVG